MAGKNPQAMRNLPLVAFRLTNDQRTACEAVAAQHGLTLNALAKLALTSMVDRECGSVNARVNAGELTVEYDPQG